MRLFLFTLLLSQIVGVPALAMRTTRATQKKVVGLERLPILKLVLQHDGKSSETSQSATTPRSTEGRRLGCGKIEIDELPSECLNEMVPHDSSNDNAETSDPVVTIENARNTYFELKRLFELELLETTQRNLAGEVLRGDSAATLKVAATFNNSNALKKFRASFVRFAISSIRAHYETEDLTTLANVLQECIHYLSKCLDEPEHIPLELVVVLKSLRDSAQQDISSSSVSVLLGSVFFLRFLTPAVAQPDVWCGITVSGEEQKALIRLAKALQLIANQIDPTHDHPYHSILSEMKSLHQQTGNFLHRIADMPITTQEAPITRGALIRDVLRTEPGIDLAALDQRVDEILGNPNPIDLAEQDEQTETLELFPRTMAFEGRSLFH